jgi:hypothetical protein
VLAQGSVMTVDVAELSIACFDDIIILLTYRHRELLLMLPGIIVPRITAPFSTSLGAPQSEWRRAGYSGLRIYIPFPNLGLGRVLDVEV